MEIKKVTPEMAEALRKPLPQEAVTQHPTKTYLSSIKAIYVVERLNEVFGIGSWHTKNKIISTSDKGMVVVHSKLTIPEYGIKLESYGGNDNGGEGSKNFDLGDAHKSACTDALTKICSYLEIGIDVFKGKVKGQPSNQQKPPQNNYNQASQQQTIPPVKPKEKGVIVVNNDKYRAALGYLEKNGLKAWEKVSSNYTISLADEAQLLKEASELIKGKQ